MCRNTFQYYELKSTPKESLSDGMYVDFKQHENIFLKDYLVLFLEGCPLLNIKKIMDKSLFIRLKQPISEPSVRQNFRDFLKNI